MQIKQPRFKISRASIHLTTPQQNLGSSFSGAALVNANSAKTVVRTYGATIAAATSNLNNKEDSSKGVSEESASKGGVGEEGTPSTRAQTASQKARAASKHAARCKCDKLVPLTTRRLLTDKKTKPLSVAMQLLGQVIKKLDEGDTSVGD